MDTGLSNLFNRDNPTKKLQQEISGMELKKQSLTSALQHEMQQLQQRVNDQLFQIGSAVYAHHLAHQPAGEGLEAFYEEIATLKRTIQEKEAKIQEFSARYDEEIKMLQMNLNMNAPQSSAPQPSSGAAFCEGCGAPYTPGADAFCGGCGHKLL